MTPVDRPAPPTLSEQARVAVRVVHRHRVAVAVVGGLVFIAFFLYALFATKIYASSVTLMSQSDTSLASLGAANMEEANMRNMGAALLGGVGAPLDQKLLNILNSRDLFDRFVNATDYLQFAYEDAWNEETQTWEDGFELNMDEAYEGFATGVLLAYYDEKSYAVRYKVMTPDPEASYRYANQILIELQHLLSKASTTPAKKSRRFIGQRLEQVQKELHEAQETLKEFQIANQMYLPESQVSGALEVVSTLEAQRISAEIKKAVLMKYTSPGHPKLRALDDEINEISAKLNEIRTGEGADEKNGTQLFPALNDAPEKVQEFLGLKRNVLIQEKLYALLATEYESAKIKEAKEDYSFFVVDHPKVPEKKYKPRRKMVVFAGMLVSILAAILTVLLLEYVPRGIAFVKDSVRHDGTAAPPDA